MASLHALRFPKPWPASDFADHVTRDLALVDSPAVRALLVVREGGGQAEVLTLATHPDAARRGLARALLLESIPLLSAPVLFLEVAEGNAPAIALYRSLGFEVFGRRPGYYSTPTGRETALLMQRRLG